MLVKRFLAVCAALLILALVPGACPAPGEGAKAERGYRRAAPVLAAIEEYRRELGSYPDSLTQLTPQFLEPAAVAVPTRPQEQYPLEYERDSTGFVLTFRYVGPGMNECRYTAAKREWECSGYF